MKFEFSAGGVVYKRENGTTYILVAQHSQHKGWVFPKGLIGDHKEGESKQETALREVEEETGVKVNIITPLSEVSYWYQFKGEKIKKTVYYYLMEYESQNLAKRDHEMDQVDWLKAKDVDTRLTYPSDKKVWKEAQTLLSSIA